MASWRGYGRGDFPAGSWQFEGGVLRAIGSAPQIDLISRERYRDFRIALEYRLPSAGNSGILYRVCEGVPQAWHSGPEMQLLDDAGHPDGADPKTSCGALYGLLAPSNETRGDANVFTSAQVVVRGSRVEHWLGAYRVLAYDLDDPRLEGLIARSKFAPYPRFAREAEGHLVLQHHGTDAWFRNLLIERL